MIARREFITLVGGAAASSLWPLAARAQQRERLRRIGMLFFGPDDDPTTLRRLASFKDEFRRLGWNEGDNIAIDVRFGAANPEKAHAYAGELVKLAPDLIVTQSGPSTRAVQAQTTRIPIVFVEVGDSVGNGVQRNISRPEGNSTGITSVPASFGGKWLELLMEAAPKTTRVLLLLNVGPGGPPSQWLPALDAVAATMPAVEVQRHPYASIGDAVHALEQFAAPSTGAIVVPPTPSATELPVLKQALMRYRMPAVYQNRLSVEIGGGVASYGENTLDLFRSAASYADRILRGARPADLPVQFASKFELVVNLKAAKAIGLSVPPLLLARADEVIE
jgi:putative tryptophan/tyrosine transport system substrate-binding protein